MKPAAAKNLSTYHEIPGNYKFFLYKINIDRKKWNIHFAIMERDIESKKNRHRLSIYYHCVHSSDFSSWFQSNNSE